MDVVANVLFAVIVSALSLDISLPEQNIHMLSTYPIFIPLGTTMCVLSPFFSFRNMRAKFHRPSFSTKNRQNRLLHPLL